MDATWHFDVVSPFAYLQLQRLGPLRERTALRPRPIVFGAVLAHLGQRGPAEIDAKRGFTYLSAQWRAERDGIALRFPPAHPFNPLAALRLIVASGSSWESVEAVFAHVWRDGRPGDTPASLADVGARLGVADIEAALASASVKEELRANTEEAIAAGVFGVPTLRFGEALFWGDDATSLAGAWVKDPARFERGEYARLRTLPVGISRATPKASGA
ncbi:2-hydroxychromene-2-carboxylate isomerase [Dokdonella sp. MW10]|uniref:2-hydroxychromene-2-carboxylate isomerase n=1 Tax=Dokdonella sp. MW10 TaxID=2992926 RepID=UPI003F7F3EDB